MSFQWLKKNLGVACLRSVVGLGNIPKSREDFEIWGRFQSLGNISIYGTDMFLRRGSSLHGPPSASLQAAPGRTWSLGILMSPPGERALPPGPRPQCQGCIIIFTCIDVYSEGRFDEKVLFKLLISSSLLFLLFAPFSTMIISYYSRCSFCTGVY